MNLLSGSELHTWRTQHDLTLNEVGELLGEVTGPTVSRWENGQDIPGPVQKLLAWLIKGIVPFDKEMVPGHVRDAMWRVEMSLQSWERLEALRVASGYATITDWIGALLREEMAEQARAESVPIIPMTRAAPEMKKVAESEEAPEVTESRAPVVYEGKHRKK